MYDWLETVVKSLQEITAYHHQMKGTLDDVVLDAQSLTTKWNGHDWNIFNHRSAGLKLAWG